MGLFSGFFNYDKEGPGVDKNAPKKKRFFLFFEYYFKNFWKLATVSVSYWILTLLVIPSGLAAAGMTNVTRNMAVDTHSFGTSDFFETIKKNWKQALPAGIINMLILGILAFDVWFFYNNISGIMYSVFMSVVFVVFLLFSIIRYYLWSIIITFKLPLKSAYKNSFKFAFIGLKHNLSILAGLALFYAACMGIALINVPITDFILLIILLFVYPGFRFLLIQFNSFENIKEYMIIPYYKDHPDDDLELRRRLGILETENEDTDNDDTDEDDNFGESEIDETIFKDIDVE